MISSHYRRLATAGLCSFLWLACGESSDDENASGGTSSTSGGSSAASGGSDASAGGSGEAPTATSAEAIAALIAGEGYKGDGWLADVMEPREASSTVSPHATVIVYLNDIAIAAKQSLDNPDAARNDDFPAGSGAVKEMYEDGIVIGHAVMLKDESDWSYYCVAPEGRCFVGSPEFSETEPAYNESACAGCHGGIIFTNLE